jgi:protein-disulfide isomerase
MEEQNFEFKIPTESEKEEMKKEEEKDKEPEMEEVDDKTDSKERKIKNMVSLIILLFGIVVGSLFVDVVQLVRRSGFSQKMLERVDVFEAKGKTWVAYSEPIVKVQVITDKNCDACKPDEVLVWLKRMLPTMLTVDVQYDSKAGQQLIKDSGVKTLPAFVFSKELDQTLFYTQAQTIFDLKESSYVMKTADLGVPAGKYLELPKITDGDIRLGNKESKVKVVEFSDFQCPYCKNFYTNVIKKLLSGYGDKIDFVYKNLPLSFHPQAENAALAVECANEQRKFEAYSDKLFSVQDDWGKSDGTQKFKTYAGQLGMNVRQFSSCLDDKKYQDKVKSDLDEANNFGISGTPAIFIGDQFRSGVVSYDEIKKLIDDQLK